MRREAVLMSVELSADMQAALDARRARMFTPATSRPCLFFIGEAPKTQFDNPTCIRPNCGMTYAQHNGQSEKRRK